MRSGAERGLSVCSSHKSVSVVVDENAKSLEDTGAGIVNFCFPRKHLGSYIGWMDEHAVAAPTDPNRFFECAPRGGT